MIKSKSSSSSHKSPRISPKKVSSPHKSRSTSPKKSSSSPRKRMVEAFTKKVAAKKIQKFTMPFIKRVSIDINDRIRTYQLYSKYFSQYDTHQCLNIIEKGNNVEYSIADNNIKIVKRIGSESHYGAIYLSKGNNVGELFRFASKIMTQHKKNMSEIKILMQVSSMVIKKATPHFPIMYYNFSCDIPNDNPKLPEFAKDENYYINLNELANGDLQMFIKKQYNNFKLVNNTIAQIIISIRTFHKIGCCHNDAHWGNFLYHKITPGGYIKYNRNGKELFIENLGYLWVIWDYSFVTRLDSKNKSQGAKDYDEIIHAFVNKKVLSNGYLPDNLPVPDNISNLVIKITDIISEVKKKSYFNPLNRSFDDIFFDRLLDETNLFINKSDLPANAKIINKVPYALSV